MLRQLIAVILSVFLAVMGISSPAYADSNIIEVSADNDSTFLSDPFVGSFVDSAKVTLGRVAGAAVVCYGIGGVAPQYFFLLLLV